MALILSIGKYGGFWGYRERWYSGKWSWRICLGWLALSYFPTDGDNIIEMAGNSLSFVNAEADAATIIAAAPTAEYLARLSELLDIARS